MPDPFAGLPLDLGLLRTFVAVVHNGSFATAAEQLAVTPSAVSGHIKRLEQAVGVSLLARTTRRLALTPAGHTLYNYGRNILDLERQARASLRGTALKGRLRVGASEDFAGTWLPHVLQSFRQSHPEVSIDLKVGITADLLRQMERGRLEVVFGKRCSGIAAEGSLLWEEPLAWAYARDQPLDTGCPLPLAVFPEPCIYRESALAALARSNQPWRIVFESSSMAGCRSAALSGFAVTVLARSQLCEGLRELSPEEGMPALPDARFHAFHRDSSRASTALIGAARTAARQRFRQASRAG